MDTKQQTLQGVAFPIQKDAADALVRFREKKLNYVQLVSRQQQSTSAFFFFWFGCELFQGQYNV